MENSFVDWIDAQFYSGLSRDWDSKRYRSYLVKRLQNLGHILDLGAGRGRIPEMNMRGIARRVTGIDLDPCVLENPYLDEALVMSDGDRLPFESESFDAVITSNVLEHVENPTVLFSEVRRVLRPSGLFISKTPNRTHYVALIASLTPHSFHEWVNAKRGRVAADTYPTLYRANSRSSIARVADVAGFNVVDISLWEGPPNYLRILPPLYPVGVAYERLVNSSERFAALRAVLVSTLQKR